MIKTDLWIDTHPQMGIVNQGELEQAFQNAVQESFGVKYAWIDPFCGSITKRVKKSNDPKDFIKIKVDDEDDNKIGSVKLYKWRWA